MDNKILGGITKNGLGSAKDITVKFVLHPEKTRQNVRFKSELKHKCAAKTAW